MLDVSSGVVTSYVAALVDRTLENGENAKSIMDYILSLKGSGIMSEQDFDKYYVRR